MKQRTIFILNTLCIAFFIGIRILFMLVPNDRELLAREQAKVKNGKSPADNRWAYFLVNKESPLPDGYKPELDTVQGIYIMDERCAGYAREMIEAAEADGVRLMVVSAYRSLERQRDNLAEYTQRLIDEGHGEDEARELALKEIAEPGTSEHNAGLSLDILTEDWWATHDDVTADFEDTEEYRWLSEHAAEYGFILRYPKEWERVTGYVYEPWHYRFVGKYYAAKIKESGLPLEYFYLDPIIIE